MSESLTNQRQGAPTLISEATWQTITHLDLDRDTWSEAAT